MQSNRPSSDNFDHEIIVVSIADTRNVEKWRVFRKKEILKISLPFCAIQNIFEYVVVRLDKKCLHDECNWICRASKLAKIEMFKIRHIIEGHICASNTVLGSNSQVTKPFVSSCIKYKYVLSHIVYTPNDICNYMLYTYGVSLNYMKGWSSREETLKMIGGGLTYSFSKILIFFFIL